MSQLYGRVFLQILDSSISEDWTVRHVFEDFLKLKNQDGVVDMTHAAFARRTNTPLDVVTRAIGILESPDKRSRDQEEDGRRLVRLDDHRDWGWRIVNAEKYERLRTDAELREFNAQRMRHYRAKKVSPAPLPKPSTESDTDTEGSTTRSTTHINNGSRRRPKDVEECLAMAATAGLSEPDARAWFADMEAGNWSKVDGTPFGNWPRELAFHRDRLKANSGHGNGNGIADKILAQTELKRAESRLQTIRTQYDSHNDWSADDRKESKALKSRIGELKQQLGFIA